MSSNDKLREELYRFLDLADNTIGAGDSIQDAYDEGTEHIRLAPDYDPMVETYPLVFDEGRPFSLEGLGPGVTQIGHTDVTDTPIIDLIGGGPQSYNGAPTLKNISVVGGTPGIRIQAAPYASLANVYVNAQKHGIRLVKGKNTCYGVTMFNVQAWNCGGDGFRLNNDAGPHATQFYGCHAIANRGVGFALRGFKTAMHGGSSQLNHGHGIDVRSPVISIKDMYIEGNGRREEFPVEIYGKEAHGLTVQDCYLHGINPRQVWHEFKRVQRAVNLHSSRSVSLRDNLHRRYGDTFFKGFDCEDALLEGNFTTDISHPNESPSGGE